MDEPAPVSTRDSKHCVQCLLAWTNILQLRLALANDDQQQCSNSHIELTTPKLLVNCSVNISNNMNTLNNEVPYLLEFENMITLIYNGFRQCEVLVHK